MLGLVVLIMGCAARRETPVLGAEDQFALAKKYYEKKKYSDAVIELQKLIFNYPGAATLDSAQFLLGMCYLNEKIILLQWASSRRCFPRSPKALWQMMPLS